MARLTGRLIAVLATLLLVTRRDLRSLSKVGLNNLAFCMIWLMMGGTARQGFWSTLMLQLLLGVPLLFSIAADALERLPETRLRMWPLSRRQRMIVALAGLATSPGAWLFGLLYLLWAGPAAAIVMCGMACLIQALVALLKATGLRAKLFRLPAPPVRLGGIFQVELYHLASTLDLYAALLLCAIGCQYRFLGHTPDPEAYPIFAMLIAITLGTYAQRSFGLFPAGSLARLRLLPLPGYRLLLAKDVAFLLVLILLVLPFCLRAGLASGLVMLAVGRWPSLKEQVPQRRGRFTAGSLGFGAMQIILGVLAGLGATRLSFWVLAGAASAWALSILLGARW